MGFEVRARSLSSTPAPETPLGVMKYDRRTGLRAPSVRSRGPPMRPPTSWGRAWGLFGKSWEVGFSTPGGAGGGAIEPPKTEGGGGLRKRAPVTGLFLNHYELWRQRR